MIAAITGLLITQGTVSWIWDVLQKDAEPQARSAEQRIVDEYRRQTSEAGIWQQPPIIFDRGFDEFRARFDEFDPRRHHAMTPDGELVPAGAAVSYAPQLVGRVIRVDGRVLDFNVVSGAEYPVDALLQIVDVRVRRAPPASEVGSMVYCRIPLQDVRKLPHVGDRVFVRGIIVAAGSVVFAQGGFRPVAYLACSGMRRR